MKRFPLVLVLIAFLIIQINLLAAEAKFWEQADYIDFFKGIPKGTAVGSDGIIRLSYPYQSIYKLNEKEFIWSSDVDSQGNLIIGTGTDAAVYKISPAGKEIWKVRLEGLHVTALVVGSNNVIYAGVSPDAVIYKISANGDIEEYFDCKEKYIWDLAINSSGDLFAATGVQGNIHKIMGKNKGDILAKIDDANITSLAIDSKNNVYGGTSEKGYVFRLDAKGKVTVLFEAPEEEIKAVYPDNKGNLYFVAVNGISKRIAPAAVKTQTKSDAKDDKAGAASTIISVIATEDDDDSVKINMPVKRTSPGVNSVLYKIDQENAVYELFKTSKTSIFDIVEGPKGNILIGGGENGRLYSYNPSDMFSLLLEVDNAQISSLSRGQGQVYLCSSNEGEIYTIKDGFIREGTYYSDVLDAEMIAKWGIVSWRETLDEDTHIRLFTRSGNTAKPDETWSNWSDPYLISGGSKIESPNARFIQWKAVLLTLKPVNTPLLDSVSVSYLQMNIAPEIDKIRIYPKGIAIKEGRDVQDIDPRLLKIMQEELSKNGNQMPQVSINKKTFQENALSFEWTVSDKNNDKLIYSLFYKEAAQKSWILLADEQENNFYTWDTVSVPDGEYMVKVIASDRPSTPDEFAKQNEKISEVFIVDNTAPVISKPLVQKSGSGYQIKFDTVDEMSPVTGSQYSLNGGKWIPVCPTDGIGDTKRESFSINLKTAKPGSSIIIKSVDKEGNTSSVSVLLN